LALLTRGALLTGFPRLTGLLARVLTGLPRPPLFLLPIELDRPTTIFITSALPIPLAVRRMLRRELAILVRHVGWLLSMQSPHRWRDMAEQLMYQ
jgi:hypothetical protein